MKKISNLFIFLMIILTLYSCTSFKKEQGLDIDYLYARALGQLKEGKIIEAKEAFEIISDNYPYKEEAIEAQVFLIWIAYLDNDFVTADVLIDSFLKYYVSNKYTDWAIYMKALIAYEQIKSSDTDQTSTLEALKLFINIYKKYTNSQYERDAFYRIEVIKYNLALRDMKIAYFYVKEKSYIAAISRYQKVVKDYEDTIFVQEAMYRLVHLWLILGVDEEAYRILSVLGYNYAYSEWYKKALEEYNKYAKNKPRELRKNKS